MPPFRMVNGALIDVETGDAAIPEMTARPASAMSEPPIVTSMTDDDGVETRLCRTCNNPFTKNPGRGKWPVNCYDCQAEGKQISPKRGTGGAMRGEAALKQALFDRYMVLGNAMMLVSPELTASIRENAESCAQADVEYARTNLKFRAMLNGTVEKTAAAAVIAAHVGMFAPVIRPLVPAPLRMFVGKPPVPARVNATGGHGPTVTPRPNPFARNGRTPAPTPNARTASPPPGAPVESVGLYIPDDFFPAQHEGQPDKTPESINAGDIDGMPSVG